MNVTVITYCLYLTISIGLTIWVARALFRNGRTFLVEVFRGNEALAESVNQLLVVGFYLVNFGFVALWLRLGQQVTSMQGSIEALSAKVGLVLLVLGTIHFINLYAFNQIRERENLPYAALPVKPAARSTVREG
jgi:hypothetical protein